MNDPIHDDQWHHVALVIKEAELPNLHDDAVLYKDGVIAEIHDIGLLDLWPIDTGSDLDVRIGRGFKGLIDDVRIYDRVLSDEEVMVLFKLESDRPLSKPKK
ncbi:MAG: LamG domain-containing protein [Planctomycetes bacterium]|nr:LamG domain-containing protein [Planctomycetota bacterium]